MQTPIAVFSDVHGNTPALEAVLREIDQIEAELIVNLGDTISGSLDPRGTLDVLLQRTDIVTVRGNGDRRLADSPSRQSSADGPGHDLVTQEDRAWLASLPMTLEVSPGVLAFHGTPTDDTTYLLETVTPEGIREATDEEIEERIGQEYLDFSLYLCGHSHLQRCRRLPGGALVLNPGSVGNQAYRSSRPYSHVVEAATPYARFSVVSHGSGRWDARHCVAEYDIDKAVAFAKANGKEEWEKSLRYGRV